MIKKVRNHKNIYKFLSLILVFICIWSLTGCGSSARYADSSSRVTDAYDSYEVAEEAVEYEAPESPAALALGNTYLDTSNSSNNTGGTGQSERKLIKTINITCETLAFDDFYLFVEKQTESLGGYIEASSSWGSEGNRSGSLTLRIPNDRTTEMENAVEEQANITERNAYSEDVTLQYSDLAAHISALRTEQKTLEEMLSQATDIETLLAIQNELSNVRYEIESYESSMNILENRIDYDTIYLSIYEVQSESAAGTQSFWEKVSARFRSSNIDLLDSLEAFAIWFLGNILTILIIVIIIILLIVIIKAVRRTPKKVAKRQAKKRKKEEKRQAKKGKKQPPEEAKAQNRDTENELLIREPEPDSEEDFIILEDDEVN